MANFTEILNIAGQRHNAKMFETELDIQSGASREKDEQAAKKILDELGLDTSDLLCKIGCIECAFEDLCNGQPLNNDRKHTFEQSCYDLRAAISKVIGE